MLKMVIDTMGSDNGTKATVPGIITFLKKHQDVEIFAVGKIEELEELKDYPNVTLIDARQVVPMEAGALDVMRMKDSSMLVAINKFLEIGADAIVSAGSTGGFLSSTTLKLKLIEGVERAALVSPFPTRIKGKKVTVLDIGASNENTPEQLVQFAKLGRIYSSRLFDIEEPKVYLLSNGAEDGKGSPTVKAAHKMLRAQNFPGFMGNMEARYVLYGEADVVVSGGFEGNIFLKGVEGTASVMSSLLKKSFKYNLLSKIGYLFSKRGFREFTETMDYKSIGGAMLLGVNGVVVKAHGNTNAYSFSCAMELAHKMASVHVVEQIKEGIKENA